MVYFYFIIYFYFNVFLSSIFTFVYFELTFAYFSRVSGDSTGREKVQEAGGAPRSRVHDHGKQPPPRPPPRRSVQGSSRRCADISHALDENSRRGRVRSQQQHRGRLCQLLSRLAPPSSLVMLEQSVVRSFLQH